jgi:hypothetical protein
MFGPSKDAVIDKLVESWNALARATSQPLTFRRPKKGWDWVLALEVLTHKDDVEIHIILCESESQAKDFLGFAAQHPGEIGIDSVHRTIGPFGQSSVENLGLKTHASWLESLNNHGVLRSKHWPPPAHFDD